MHCPLETPETRDLLVEYCLGTLTPAQSSRLEPHVAACPACSRFAAEQRSVWSALDRWEAAPVSADFDRRLYARIDSEVTWRGRVLRALGPLLAYRGIPAAVAACLVLGAGILMQRSGHPVAAPAVPQAGVEIQADQVQSAFDTMDLLSEFAQKPHSDASAPKKL